jgi:hypothetical protein
MTNKYNSYDDKYQAARDRMSDIYQFSDDQLDFIFSDWSEPDHTDWLLSATLEEILDWGDKCNWGKE